MAKNPMLIVDNPSLSAPQPARTLDKSGMSLWHRITAEYRIDDCTGIEFLTLACQSLDRAEALAARIREDGEIVRTPTGIKMHPAVKEELACRAFVVRTLQKLGLNYEPLRAGPGRPPGGGA